MVGRRRVSANHPRRVKRAGGAGRRIAAAWLRDRLTWLGHATVLLELGGARFVTDPVLRPRVAHLRREAPVPGALGRLDACWSRTGTTTTSTCRRCAASTGRRRWWRRRTRPARCAARGTGAHAGPGDEVELAGVRVRAVRAAHDGRRLPVGTDASASASSRAASTSRATPSRSRRWRSWRDARRRADPGRGLGAEVGPGHMDPREAAEALALLRPRMAVPIHWGTYRRIGHRGTGDPAREFVEHAAELAPDVRVAVLEPGGSVEITRAV